MASAFLIPALRPSTNFRAFRDGLVVIFRNRELLRAMTNHSLGSQYAGQVLGIVWVVIHPLSLLLLFAVVFGLVLKVRITGSYEVPFDYTTYLLAGLVPWLTLQQVMMRSCSALIGQSNLVKQVVFPIEVLPAVGVSVGLVTQLVMISLLLVYVLIRFGIPPATYLLLPMLLLLQVLGMLGLAFALAAVSPFFKDLKDIVQVLSTAGMYLMPAVYLPEWVPGPIKPLLYINPFSYMIWCYQDAIYFGALVHPYAWWVYGVGCVATFLFGYRLFRWLKPHFGSVL